MATWKKVVVSGSAISQLTNDAGYLTSVTATNAFVTFSANGVNVIADNANDTVTFASSSGAGLTITGDAGADSITFGLSAIPNSSLANSTISGISLGSNLAALTAGSGLSAAGTYTGATARTVSIDTGSAHFTGGVSTEVFDAGNFIDSSEVDFTVVAGTSVTAALIAGSIANSKLTNSSITIAGQSTALGGSVTAATIGAAIGAFSGSSQVDHDATTNFVLNEHINHANVSISAGSGLSGGGDITTTRTLTLNTGSTHFVDGARAAITVADTTGASGIDLTYSGGQITGTLVNSAITIAGNSTSLGGSITAATILSGTGVVSGSSLSSAAQGEVVLTTNGVAASAVDLGLQTTDSPQFVGLTLTGDAAVNGGDITTSATSATVFNTNATTINAFGAATTLNLGAATGTTTVGNSLVVTGDLFVNGTTTQVNTADLYVEDKFIVLASGSASAGDGGIMIDRGTDPKGNIAYGFDATTARWGFENGLADTGNALVPDAFVPYLFTEATHGATKPTTGEFAVLGSQYMSAAGDFWIYTA